MSIKCFQAWMLGLFCLVLAACSSGPDTRAEGFTRAVATEQTGAALEYVDPGLKSAFGSKLATSVANAGKKIQSKGGLLSVETSSEVDGDFATVTIVQKFGDGSTTTEKMKMRKVEGEWYVTM